MTSATGQSTREDTIYFHEKVIVLEDLLSLDPKPHTVSVLPDVIITPPAQEYLHQRGIRILHSYKLCDQSKYWGLAFESPSPNISLIMNCLMRRRLPIQPLISLANSIVDWLVELCDIIKTNQRAGLFVFSSEPSLLVAMANKISEVRAVAVYSVDDCIRACLWMDANLIATRLEGLTIHEAISIISECTRPRSQMLAEPFYRFLYQSRLINT